MTILTIREKLHSFVLFAKEGAGLLFHAVDVVTAMTFATKSDPVEEDGTATNATLINHIRALAIVTVYKITTLIRATFC